MATEEVPEPGRKKELEKGAITYVEELLKETDVVLQADLSQEQIKELEETPAYTRRHIKIDRA